MMNEQVPTMTILTTDRRDKAAASRALRLRQATHQAHERLDGAVMALDPFASRENYLRLLTVHYHFHRDVAPLYRHPPLIAAFHDLSERRRLEAIRQDFIDLGTEAPAPAAPPLFDQHAIDLSVALGWLYVAEGSTLGAAILLKAVRGIGLDAQFGARHLAGHGDGRAQHWRDFVSALDRVVLEPAQDARVIEGAIQAFERVEKLVERQHA